MQLKFYTIFLKLLQGAGVFIMNFDAIFIGTRKPSHWLSCARLALIGCLAPDWTVIGPL